MRFKAKFAPTTIIPSPSGDARIFLSLHTFSLSKRKIFFNLSEGESINDLGDKLIVHYGQEYSLLKVYKDDDFMEWSKKARFQAKFNDEKRVALIMDRWNGIKLRIIHNRYWVQKNHDFLFKTLIAAAIGFLFAIIGTSVGYHQGYQSGLKEGLSHRQDTVIKR